VRAQVRTRALAHARAAFALIAWLAAGWAGPAAAECTRVVFSAHPDYPPYHWAEGEKLTGASVALTGRLLDELGVPWEARFVGPWPRVLKSAEYGEIDLVVSLKRTPEREAYLSFSSVPAFPNPMAIFTRQDRRFDYARPEDLLGKVGGRSAGDRFGEVFDRFADQHLRLEDADSPGLNFSKLAAGRIDYVVTGLYTGRAQLLSAGLAERITPLPALVNRGEIHHGFSRRSPCTALLAALDARLAAAQKAGLPAQLLEEALRQWKLRASKEGRP
jgi:polar amino acid transport system substrate-binding protein